MKDKKKNKKKHNLFAKQKTMNPLANELSNSQDQIIESSEDYIDSIYARKKMYSSEDSHGKSDDYEQVVIKLRHQEVQVYLLQYVLELD